MQHHFSATHVSCSKYATTSSSNSAYYFDEIFKVADELWMELEEASLIDPAW